MGDGVIQTSPLSSVRVPQLFMEVGVTHPPPPPSLFQPLRTSWSIRTLLLL